MTSQHPHAPPPPLPRPIFFLNFPPPHPLPPSPQDIFRRYPDQYESIIATLCENLDTLDEPEAKASMIWIIGEYAERIENADELLEQFLESFPEETSMVGLGGEGGGEGLGLGHSSC